MTPDSDQLSLLSRRQWLGRMGMGMGGLGLAPLLATNQARALNPLEPRGPHFPGKAKRVIHLFMNGGPSHVDTFDPKPELTRQHGKLLARPNLGTERKTGAALASPFPFQKHGQSGLEISSLFPHVARMADELCVIRSMHGDVPNHEPSLLLLNCGDARQIRPSMGSWVTYGLGAENQNLPGFITMCPDGYPIQETQNWHSAFLPGAFQGTYINTRQTDIDKLVENIKNAKIPLPQQRRQLDLVAKLNARHLNQHPGDAALESRIQSFELAYRMQMDATDAFDVNRETKQILDLYGPGVQGRQMLIARRLLERGVRFVQIWHGAGQPWDSHDDLEFNHKNLAKECDQAIGALLVDLKQRGMLEDTLVVWGGEFGRTPTVELPTPGANAGKINGRDHNHWGFTMWMAGGGVKGGYAHGATDEFGFQAVNKKVHFHDLQATILHLLGFDHERLTYRFAGRDFRLTDIHGHVVRDLIA
ncbi:MAG: DUF1501 domain-containing protein [Gemmataceae bacterium]